MRFEDSELNWIQRNFRYAAVNNLYPDMITAHIVDVPKKEAIEITAYFNIDGKSMRMDVEIYYEALETVDDLTKFILETIDLHMTLFKEKNK
jgi:hypothetical protein